MSPIGRPAARTLAALLILNGFYTLQPNEGAAITLFGNYKGTDRTPGLRWMLPWYTRKKISLRVRNVTGEKLKVNDNHSNPIEIGAVVVWKVVDTAEAVFEVDDYQQGGTVRIMFIHVPAAWLSMACYGVMAVAALCAAAALLVVGGAAGALGGGGHRLRDGDGS